MATAELVPLPQPQPQLPAIPSTSAEVVDALLAGLAPKTVQAYQSDLRDFARWLGSPSPSLAVERLLGAGNGAANALAHSYRASLHARDLAPKTIGRRLAALRSVVTFARTLGRVDWTLDCRAPRAERRRDVRGPDRADMKRLWKTLAGDAPQARRDRAMVALLFDLALRRNEVLALDLADVDLSGGTVAVVGKGHREAQRLTLPPPTKRAIEGWIEARGIDPGPLFHRMDRAAQGGRDRLTGDGLAGMLADLGTRAELSRPLRPHGLRHAAITAALELGLDIREVRKFSRHSKLETVLLYDDERQDVAGKVARKVAGDRR